MAIVSRADRGESLTPQTPTTRATCETPPLSVKLTYSFQLYSLQASLSLPAWYKSWQEYFSPPPGGPDIVKKYGWGSSLPVRIFFPADHDKTSPKPLPTVFTIHGGGFCLGTNRDDDEYNRFLADSQKVLVVSLNYSKSPAAVFPRPVHDVEKLYLAVIADQSLPIARAGPDTSSRIAVLGFSAGGNLAMAMSQLPSIKGSPNAPSAAISVYGTLDFTRDSMVKLRNRFYKPALPLPQGARMDSLAGYATVYDWSYIPYGHDLKDPLLCPVFAPAEALPKHTYFIAAELDILGHESWRMAVRVGNEAKKRANKAKGTGSLSDARDVPDADSKLDRVRCVGKRASNKRKGYLEDLGGDEDRFGWEDVYADGSSVNWLCVPDVLHGFDHINVQNQWESEESKADAQLKTKAYVERVGKWLHNVVWK
ncbi:alpha beta hydrolase fold protein [Ophiostoma piceae UAMH 11346]|uniref:Alpha beta hydrolase fold protein n=1 Tax=Ophiostoma piceae (strain UAMH 11346) TaxID=1262450 RepID=S3CBK5_OPHP1|nr:alpha beta hydrolase fold protein [Ophiostoma piceae UAMH 11346]